MNTQRWAVIGCGSISRTVGADLLATPGVEVAVAYGRDAARAAAFAAELGIAASTDDYEAVLADPTIDAVYIATPFATHHDLAARALRAGKHALVEKPIALDASQAADLFRIAREEGRFLAEAMWMKWNPAFRRLHQELAAGRIGEARSLRAHFALPFPPGNGSRLDPARSGSTLLDQGIYPVTLAHSVFGMPESVHARGVVADNGVDLAEHFTLDFPGGRFAQCASGMTEFTDPSAAVCGTRGWLTLPPMFWATTSLEIHADDFETLFTTPERVDLPKEGNGYRPMLREVVADIAAGRLESGVHPAQDTLEVFVILDQIRAQLG